MIDERLRRRLLEAVRRDAEARERLAADGSLFDGYHPEMRAVHEANAAELRAILDAGGWPAEEEVGADGAEAAWRITQHAIGEPDFQRLCLAKLQEAAAAGRVPAWQPAYLMDRIRTFEGRPQLYGTQFDWDEAGEMSPLPIEDPDNVEHRRASVGLPALAEVIGRRRADSDPEPKPRDFAARQREFEAWAREVGWRS